MRRKLANEHVERLRDSQNKLLALHRKCIRFAADNKNVIKANRPELAPSLNGGRVGGVKRSTTDVLSCICLNSSIY